MKHLVLAAIIGLSFTAAPAEARTQLERLVDQELRSLGFKDVKVSELSTGQLSAIYSTANRPGRQGEKRGMIKSILGGKNSVRGLISR